MYQRSPLSEIPLHRRRKVLNSTALTLSEIMTMKTIYVLFFFDGKIKHVPLPFELLI